jgi:pyruvate dehydrogenase E2 component (dihydrolipoamide acetyltransferase)
MPKLSPTMETGVITQWLVKVGDPVKEGDALAEIETDKATMQMKSYDDGTVALFDHAAGDEVPLGERVLVLAAKGEDPQAVAQAMGGGGGKPAKAPGPPPESRPSQERPDRHADGRQPEPEAGNGQQPTEEAQRESASPRLKVSPLARKLAEASRIDLAQIRGSGPGGRIVQSDVEAYIERQAPVPAGQAATEPAGTREPPPAPAPVSRESPQPPGEAAPRQAGPSRAAPSRAAAPPPPVERIPHSRMRKTIAQRMVQAKQAAPEIHLTVDIRVDRLGAAREELNKRLAGEGIKLSLGDFVSKAVAQALRAHPGVNSSFQSDAIVRHGEVHIGMAVALPDGLIVPVLHHADTLGLREIRRQTEALVAAARGGKLTADQLTGSTFTISNLGMYGVRQFDAILNVPEAGILSVGAAEKRPVVEGDHLTVGTVMTVTLTADHRAIDGALGAEFLKTIKGLLEEPTSMLL